jgi:hypothetical protein
MSRHAVDADIQDVIAVKEAAPEPGEIFASRVLDAAEEISWCGMLESPASYVLAES